jgi:hypothetical protein
MNNSLPIFRINGEEYLIDKAAGEARSKTRPTKAISLLGRGGFREYIYWFNEIQHFIGKRVMVADLQLDDGQWFPYLKLEDGSGVILLSDEEGNGPGRFGIIEHQK